MKVYQLFKKLMNRLAKELDADRLKEQLRLANDDLEIANELQDEN